MIRSWHSFAFPHSGQPPTGSVHTPLLATRHISRVKSQNHPVRVCVRPGEETDPQGAAKPSYRYFQEPGEFCGDEFQWCLRKKAGE